ncbi:M23 family metallopeptidase [Bacteroidota bacterium]|nr:M23 family metallopeptidase [Bacteroidota bacterium]
MKIRTFFILIILVGCESLQKKQSVDYLDEFKGYSGHILYIDDYPNAEGYLIKKNGSDYRAIGLPYVTQETIFEFGNQKIKVFPLDYGESRITIEDESLVNLSPEDTERANNEARLVRELVSKNSPQSDFTFKFISPVDNYITSKFGKKRYINDQPRSPHLALDIDGVEGDPVIAPMDGTVILVDQHFYSGKFIILDHGGGLFTSYSHLNKWLVEEGETVLKAEKIGEVGSTGRVTGPHLHWVVYLNTNKINPELLVKLEEAQD